MPDDLNHDRQVRLAAFAWLAEQRQIHGRVLPRTLLRQGFPFSGERIHLIFLRGIFTPKVLNYPISITTSPNRRYPDKIAGADFILYKYRGEDPMQRDNVRLREAMELQLPLVYFHGIVPGEYFTAWPVYVISDNPEALEFTVAIDDPKTIENASLIGKVADEGNARRAYITSREKNRLRQCSFREEVLHAYRKRCALCALRHKELLDAAHIIPYAEEGSTMNVDNGISLCKIHHAAFDRLLIGIRPDFKVEVKRIILEEKDGPMLQHGLKALHGGEIIRPHNKASWPNRDFLARRYDEFVRSA